MRHNIYMRGQAALIALLVLTIATTVGLSLIARSTTDVSITRNVEDSSRAFSAAEAGVELALRTGADASATDPTLNTTYSAKVTPVTGDASHPIVFPSKTQVGNTETIWLTNHNADGSIDDSVPVYTAPSITMCWSVETPAPAIVVSVFYKESSDGSYRVAKAAYDPDSSRISGASGNNFSTFTSITIDTGPCANTYKIPITFSTFNPAINPASDVLIALRIRPVYNGTKFTIIPAATLPGQGNQIESVGSTTSGVNRKIIVYQQYKSPATIFDAAVYSEQGSFSQVTLP